MLFFMKKPRNFHYLVNIYFTIKKFKKGLKLACYCFGSTIYFTIKKFKKGLKQYFLDFKRSNNFTIKKFKKGLK
ncbi:hypothetical protein DXS65_05125 [Campylobacter jejuni]|uniref:Uncharacterized protein n=1 Tax=Campylobacter jejuni TaxID=197 RepID=A0A5T2B574_CAMJU|nr:hypothetical protein [Campylobacter jejuni]EAH5042025.1 hypothetical protein [Campylobacter jejuni]EAH5542508.1 hypothetical protein [Campylobacter jejuni]EAH6513518.1 hypothetical protein [Campylobacter jejuni]EAH8279102.1 hypothetical protein [Campylobacter jejuni]